MEKAAPELLAQALAGLTERELDIFQLRMAALYQRFEEDGMRRVAAVWFALAVVADEEHSRRSALAEHARVELDGPEVGALLTDAEAAEFFAIADRVPGDGPKNGPESHARESKHDAEGDGPEA
jgi:hypothetical protein